jgi:hypothetical protein
MYVNHYLILPQKHRRLHFERIIVRRQELNRNVWISLRHHLAYPSALARVSLCHQQVKALA